MNKLEKKIRERIKNEYRYPHDIEAVASDIYKLKLSGELSDTTLLVDFLDSVACSKYTDIANITYEYLERLAQSQGALMYEEYQKIAHLFDSINILIYLGVKSDDCVLERSERLILNLLDKKDKAMRAALDGSKPWVNKILQNTKRASSIDKKSIVNRNSPS